jgi:hypothetical protein
MGLLASVNMFINAWQCLSVGEIKMKKEFPKNFEIVVLIIGQFTIIEILDWVLGNQIIKKLTISIISI